MIEKVIQTNLVKNEIKSLLQSCNYDQWSQLIHDLSNYKIKLSLRKSIHYTTIKIICYLKDSNNISILFKQLTYLTV